MRPAFYFDERTLWFSAGQAVLVLPVGGWLQPPAGGGHADSPEPKRRLHSLMQTSGLISAFDVKTAPQATTAHLTRIHPQSYLDTFKSMSDAGGGALHFSAPFGPGSYEIAALSAGLVEAAVMDVANGTRKRSYAISRPSGHHCLPDQPMGFCMFANVALAAMAARDAGMGRIAIVDWDVHHGNGTEAIFWDDPNVLTVSIHQESCFPPGASGQADARGGTGAEGTTLNIPLWPGCGHAAYIAAFEQIIAPAVAEFEPDMIIVVNGLDANGVDPLARMLAHSETFRAMTKGILTLADSHCEGRAVFVQEGGYAESYVPFCALAVLEELAGVRTEVEDPFLELIQAQQPGPDATAAQIAAVRAMAQARGASA
jgi:acetoin utilization deacetylase AcuC-like enzyme